MRFNLQIPEIRTAITAKENCLEDSASLRREPLWRGVRQEITVMLSGFATASRDGRPAFPRASTAPRESTNGVSMQGTSARYAELVGGRSSLTPGVSAI
jgi:hypothetical protein